MRDGLNIGQFDTLVKSLIQASKTMRGADGSDLCVLPLRDALEAVSGLVLDAQVTVNVTGGHVSVSVKPDETFPIEDLYEEGDCD
jgi:hypothetical protein